MLIPLANVLQLLLQEDYKDWWEREIKHFSACHMFVILLVAHSPTTSATEQKTTLSIHSLRRFLIVARQGELRQRKQEDLANQSSCLTLVNK